MNFSKQVILIVLVLFSTTCFAETQKSPEVLESTPEGVFEVFKRLEKSGVKPDEICALIVVHDLSGKYEPTSKSELVKEMPEGLEPIGFLTIRMSGPKKCSINDVMDRILKFASHDGAHQVLFLGSETVNEASGYGVGIGGWRYNKSEVRITTDFVFLLLRRKEI